jgi:hypothetical protein
MVFAAEAIGDERGNGRPMASRDRARSCGSDARRRGRRRQRHRRSSEGATCREAAWRIVRCALTPLRAMAACGPVATGALRRCELQNLRALNDVIADARGGGVTRSRRDHGKVASSEPPTNAPRGQSSEPTPKARGLPL